MLQIHKVAVLAAVLIAASAIFHGSSNAAAGPILMLQSDALLIPVGHRGVFLGCVWSRHQCSHRALATPPSGLGSRLGACQRP